MRHRIKNHGPDDIKITDARGVVWTLEPGKEGVYETRKIFHGDKRAHYEVEPAGDA